MNLMLGFFLLSPHPFNYSNLSTATDHFNLLTILSLHLIMHLIIGRNHELPITFMEAVIISGN